MYRIVAVCWTCKREVIWLNLSYSGSVLEMLKERSYDVLVPLTKYMMNYLHVFVLYGDIII